MADQPFQSLEAFIDARNAILHGLGTLTRRQRNDNTRGRLFAAGMQIVGGTLVPACRKYRRALLVRQPGPHHYATHNAGMGGASGRSRPVLGRPELAVWPIAFVGAPGWSAARSADHTVLRATISPVSSHALPMVFVMVPNLRMLRCSRSTR